MNLDAFIQQLEKNKTTFYSLCHLATKEEYVYKQNSDKWCMLEIICHLLDEEREDFKVRLKNVLETPDKKPPQIDPVAWVTERDYIHQNFEETLLQFLLERDRSIEYLKALKEPNWENGYTYADFGRVTGKFFLSNWLAHDYLHLKQITRLKYDYLSDKAGNSLNYAGKWI